MHTKAKHPPTASNFKKASSNLQRVTDNPSTEVDGLAALGAYNEVDEETNEIDKNVPEQELVESVRITRKKGIVTKRFSYTLREKLSTIQFYDSIGT